MSRVLNNGASALLAFQRAIATTSHNIANVNTEGYSRQRVELEALAPESGAGPRVGRGTRVRDIERLHDRFAGEQLLRSVSAHARQDTHLGLARRLDALVASDSLSLTPALDAFFGAVQDAAADPGSAAAREALLAAGDALGTRFGALQRELDATATEVGARLGAELAEVSERAAGVAELNRRIIAAGNGDGAHELRDRRDTLIGEIAARLDVQVIERDDGAVDLALGNGRTLVIGTLARALRATGDPTAALGARAELGDGERWEPLGPVDGGSIGGLDDFARETLGPAAERLGHVARGLAEALNARHVAGVTPDGSPGQPWFDIAAPRTAPSPDNGSNATLGASVTDAAALVASDYLVRFEGGTLEAVRRSDGEVTSGTAPLVLDGLEITLSGPAADGDTFVVSANSGVAGALGRRIEGVSSLALASRLGTSAALGNAGDASAGSTEAIDLADPALDRVVDIVFTADDRFDVVDRASGAALATGVTYASGDEIAFNGWRTRLDGAARAGDTFTVAPVATPSSDNGNALALAGIADLALADGAGTANDEYGALVSMIGGRTRALETRAAALETLRDDASDRVDAVSGVDLDEEAIALTRFEQAYRASAQVIATADSLFESILGAVAR